MNNRVYDNRQLTTLSRHRNNINAHKILDIRGNNLVFRIRYNSDKTEEITVSLPEDYNIGEYIDLAVTRMSKTSKIIELVGHTPEGFIPVDGADIG